MADSVAASSYYSKLFDDLDERSCSSFDEGSATHGFSRMPLMIEHVTWEVTPRGRQ